jgi:hypothetical protein
VIRCFTTLQDQAFQPHPLGSSQKFDAVIEASKAQLIVAGTYYKNHERILALNERQLGAYPCEHQTMACASVISAIGMRRSSALQWQQVRSR